MNDSAQEQADTSVDPGGEEESQVDPAILREADDQGWVPLEKWHGKEEDWVDAERYVKRGREVNRILNKSLDKERAKTRQLEADLIALKGTVNGLAEYRATLEKTVYNQAMRDLKAQLRAAREAGDTSVAADVEDQLDALKEKPPTPYVPPAPQQAPQSLQEHPAVTAWRGRNTWYDENTNPEMVEYADGVTLNAIKAAKQKGVQIDPAELLETVTAKTKRMFPDKFGGGTQAAMFEGGGRGGASRQAAASGGRSFASLPPDAKREFKRFYDAGYYPNMKLDEAQAEYHKVYNEGR